jgi:drug/metabolite transporter (DMT)-like permease
MVLNRLRLPIILGAGIVAVSLASILIKFALAEQIPPLVIAASRLGIASLIMTPLGWARARDEIRSLTRGEALLAIASGVFLALHFAFWITSFDYTSVMSSVVLVATNPLFVALASVILLRESLTRSTWTGILVAVVGGFIVGAADLGANGASVAGDLLALAGSIAVSGYVLIGRRLRSKLSLLGYVGVVYSTAALILLTLAIASGASFADYSPSGYLLLILIALVPQVLGHTAFNYALRYISAALVAVLLLSEPVGATLLAVPLLGEIPSRLKLLGGALVLAGILIATRTDDHVAQPAHRGKGPEREGHPSAAGGRGN